MNNTEKLTNQSIPNNRFSRDSKLRGHLSHTWGIDERLIPDMMTDDPFDLKILEFSFRHYEIATHFVKGKRVLDIACGTGYGSRILAQAGAKKTVGVDVCDETIEYACNHYLVPGVEFICADAINFSASELFDVICTFETIEHLQDPMSFLRNLYSLLTPGGCLILSVPLGETRHLDPYHLQAFSQKTIFSLVESVGFSIEIYRCDPFRISLSDLIRIQKIYPESQPSISDLLLTKRGWRTLFEVTIKRGFSIPLLMLTARKHNS
ncbi:MAG: methyltransferase domain-containing protein [Crocosphaera sp.]|nr:methyltransferase domain-containing protein [Crocosphaera sp.]